MDLVAGMIINSFCDLRGIVRKIVLSGFRPGGATTLRLIRTLRLSGFRLGGQPPYGPLTLRLFKVGK